MISFDQSLGLKLNKTVGCKMIDFVGLVLENRREVLQHRSWLVGSMDSFSRTNLQNRLEKPTS